MNAIILLAHGSRDARWSEPFERLRAAVVQRRGDTVVQLAYLEHTTPDFSTAVDQLVAKGASSVEVVPVFLGAGGHVRIDVPRLVEQASHRHRGTSFQLRPIVGDSTDVLEAIADHIAATIDS